MNFSFLNLLSYLFLIKMKEQKNQKKIVFFLIIIITLILYYGVRRNEEYYEKLIENKYEQKLTVDKLLKGQIEDDIHLNNSKLLNIKINVDQIKKVINEEQLEKENTMRTNNEVLRFELWTIETLFLSIFCIIIGGLYFYSSKEQNKKKNKFIKEKYLNDNRDYCLAESEMEYLINNGEIENSYKKWEDE
jgi:hypothetical protein